MREFWLRRHVRPSARTDCRAGGRETGQPLGTGVFGQFSLAGNRVAALHLATPVFLAGNHISDEQRAGKSTRKEATKFEKFERRNPRANPRRREEEKTSMKPNVKLREVE